MNSSTIRALAAGAALTGLFYAAFAALGADSPTTKSPERWTTITIPGGEPVFADNQQLSVSGSCYQKDIAIRFVLKSGYGESYIAIRVGDTEQKYDSTTPLVKDLFVGSKASYQFRLFCNRDEKQTMMLTAWGTSLALPQPKFVQTKIIFDAQGKIVAYGGPREEDYDFIRGHMW